MKKIRFAAVLALATAAALGDAVAHAQALPTASQAYRISAFAGASGVFTGLDTAKNVSITAGGNFGFRKFFSLEPSLTVRGTYPISKGSDVGEKSLLGGIQVEKRFGRYHPYVDFLYGRGELDYVVPHPDLSGTFYYEVTSSNVLSPGAGVDIDLTRHFALKLDGQYQKYDTPVTSSGNIYSKVGTVGAVYRFDFNHGRMPSSVR